MTAILTIKFVVSSHNGPHTSFLYGSFKSRKVDFVQCTFIHNSIYRRTLGFLIINCKMFYTS